MGSASKLTCGYCCSRNVVAINAYKHIWKCCPDCGSAFSEPKSQYAFELAVPLLKKLSPKFRILAKDPVVEDDGSRIYDYMATDSHVENHRRRRFFERFMTDYASKCGIDIEGRAVLDVSGGNGFFAKQIQDAGARVVMTEYNQASVDYAKREFGVEAYRYDFNSQKLTDLFPPGRFDVVCLRSSIMFAADMRRMVAELKTIMRADGAVFVLDSISPTLGTMLKRQLDQYNLVALYAPEAIVGAFEQLSYRLVHRVSEPGYVWSQDLTAQNKGRTSLFAYALGKLYEIPARLRLPGSMPVRDLRVVGENFVFVQSSGSG